MWNDFRCNSVHLSQKEHCCAALFLREVIHHTLRSLMRWIARYKYNIHMYLCIICTYLYTHRTHTHCTFIDVYLHTYTSTHEYTCTACLSIHMAERAWQCLKPSARPCMQYTRTYVHIWWKTCTITRGTRITCLWSVISLSWCVFVCTSRCLVSEL